MARHNTIKAVPIQCNLMSRGKRHGNDRTNKIRKHILPWQVEIVERIKTNFHGQDVPYETYCNATAVLKTDSVYRQRNNYHPQVYAKEYKYTDAEKQQCFMLSNDDDDGYFEV